MAMWIICLENGPTRVNHAAVPIKDSIYSFGGYCTGDDYETPRPIDVHRFYTVTLKWTLLPLPTSEKDLAVTPYQRYGHTVVEHKGNAFLWGGRNDSIGACNVLYRFDGVTYMWDAPEVYGCVPEARDGHTACVINSKMYIFAGYDEISDTFSNDMNYCDLSTFTWTVVHVTNKPARWRDFHTTTAVGNIMYIFGGRCDEGGETFTNHEMYCNKVVAFDTSTKQWSRPVHVSENLPVGRRSHSAFEYKGSLYIFGGFNGLRCSHYNDIHRLDLTTMEWSEQKYPGVCPSPRRRQCACLVNSKVYIFGGTRPKIKDKAMLHYPGSELVDCSDLYVLDLEPSLKTLACAAIIKYKLDRSSLPSILRRELSVMEPESIRQRTSNGCCFGFV